MYKCGLDYATATAGVRPGSKTGSNLFPVEIVSLTPRKRELNGFGVSVTWSTPYDPCRGDPMYRGDPDEMSDNIRRCHYFRTKYCDTNEESWDDCSKGINLRFKTRVFAINFAIGRGKRVAFFIKLKFGLKSKF